MSNEKPLISILPLQYADISACARIAAASFEIDRHTIVKQLGQKPFDMKSMIDDSLQVSLSRKNCIHVKAVDDETGEIVGHIGWGFRGVNGESIPRSEPTDGSTVRKETRAEKEGERSADDKHQTAVAEKDPIDRLHALEDADMRHWMEILMPSGVSCMYVLGLYVAPGHQGRGVGSALIRHGTAVADELGIFTWVHASEAAWKAFTSNDFEVVGELDVDLDEYAPSPPKDEGEGATWGHYVLRYMKRLPSGNMQAGRLCSDS